MKRRELMLLLLGASTVPLLSTHTLGQQDPIFYRVGLLGAAPATYAERIEAFRQGLHDLGYVEGRNIAIEYRWAEGDPERTREIVEEFVRLKVDVIIVPSSIYTEAAKRGTSEIPIVLIGHADPVGTGHVTSLSHPGGNITGVSVMLTETSVKSLELLKQAVPELARVAVMFDPAAPSHVPA